MGFFDNIGKAFKNAGRKVENFISDVGKETKTFFRSAESSVHHSTVSITSNVASLYRDAKNVAASAYNDARSVANNVYNDGKNLVTTGRDKVFGLADKVIDKASGVIEKGEDTVSNIAWPLAAGAAAIALVMLSRK